MEKYTFSEKGHCHYLNGKSLTGITTILGVIAKPQLISWAANMAVDYIKEHGKGDCRQHPFTWLVDEFILEDARTAHIRKKETAGQQGTDVHAIIEGIIKEAIKVNNGIIGIQINWDNSETKIPQVKHFLDWAIKNEVRFLESEKHIYSVKHFLGGIVDFICEISGDVWVGDIKTSSGIYAEFFFQTAGYQILLQEMGLYPDIKGHIILNLKKDGSFNEKRSISNEQNKQAFLSALSLYRIKAMVEGNLI